MFLKIGQTSIGPYAKRLLIMAIFASPMAIVAPTVFAAGSGGGGFAGSPPSSSGKSLTPEEQSAKLYRSGLKQKDRALAQLQKAEAASSDKARNKAKAKAEKAFAKAIKKQGEALSIDPRNYKAANELGYALRRTGDYEKAVGAYNYALKLNPNFHEATEYRGEAFLALGFYKQAMQSYMILFRNDRDLADQLMATMDKWVSDKNGEFSESEQSFVNWIKERKQMAKITRNLSMNNTRNW